VDEGLAPDLKLFGAVLEIGGLPVADADGDDFAGIIDIDELARAFLGFAGEVFVEVVAVDVVLVAAAVEFDALEEFFLDVGSAGGGGEGGQPVFMGNDAVEGHAGLPFAGPFDEAGHAEGAFPVRVLLAAEGRGAGVRPGVVVRAVVGGVLDDGVVGDAEFVDELEQLADVHVVLDHAVVVFVAACSAEADVLGFDMGAEVHAGAVPPAEERLAGLVHGV
jgi:CBS domain-containing protein